MLKTKLSSRGQIVIPQNIRESHHWKTGECFEVHDLAEGILLTPIKKHNDVQARDLLGSIGYHGPKKSLDDMDKAILEEAKKKNDQR